MSAGQIIVALATESAIKKDATVMAFGSACPSYGVKLQCFATPSHINEQPEGFQETMRGATNRLDCMNKIIPDGVKPDYKVAIENGLWLDFGWVVLESSKTGRRYVSSSTGIPFATQFVEKAREEGFDSTTVGDVMAKELGCDTKDPHSYLCNNLVGRKAMLIQAIQACLGQCLRHEGNL